VSFSVLNGVVLFGVVLLHLFAVCTLSSSFVCLILMVEFNNIFADSKKKKKRGVLKKHLSLVIFGLHLINKIQNKLMLINFASKYHSFIK
jgi:hypothetical protein